MDSITETKMTPIEKLFVHILDRKKSIIQQVKHQTDLFDHHLASKCLLDGITPPPWLFPSHVSLPKELKKEDIISGLLFPHSNPYSSSQFSVMVAPVVSANNVELPNDSHVEAFSEKVSASVDGLSVLPRFCAGGDGQCGLNGVLEVDCSVTSPQDCGNAAVLDHVAADQGQSLARIQRSKSRQLALELRSSAKTAKMFPHDENDGCVCGRQIVGSAIGSLHFDHADGLGVGKAFDASNKRCVGVEQEKGECKAREDYGDVFSGRVTRSASSNQEVGLVSESNSAGVSSFIAREDSGAKSFGGTVQWPNHVHELSGLAKPSSVIADVNCAAEGANMSDFKGNKVATSTLLEVERPSFISGKNQGARNEKIGDEWSKEKGTGTYFGRIMRSRGSSQHPNHNNEYLNLDSSCGAKEEGKIGECRDQDNCSSDVYCGGSKRCRSSSKQIWLVNGPRNDGMSSYNAKEGGRLKSLDTLIEQPNHVHELSEMAKLSSVTANVNCAAVEAIAGGFKANKMATSIDFGGIMRFRSSSPSSEPPQPLSLAGGQVFGLQKELATHVNAVPCTESDNTADLERCDGVVADTDSDSDELVVSSGSRPPNECAMLVKPKLLDFDVEACSLNETSDPALENKQPCISPEKSPPTLLHSTDILDAIVSVDCRKNSNSFYHEYSSKEKKPWNDSSKDIVKVCPVLTDENATESVQKKTVTSPSQHADTYPIGTLPKMGSQLFNVLSTSPIMVGNAGQPSAGNTVEDIHQNVAQQMEGAHEFLSPELPMEKVEPSLERKQKCGSAAFTLMCEQLEAPSGSCLPDAVSQDCLLEKAQVVDAISITFGAIEQDALDENKILLRLGGGFDQGSSKLLTHTEKIMQEIKSRGRTNGDLSYCSVGSMHKKSMNLIDADQSMPEFEGFVMDADEQLLVDEVPIDFDTLDLPTSALERVSYVERLCKSCCLHKSLSRFSGTYKLHKTLNLFQSIPSGLLEGMELRSTPIVKGDTSKQLEASSSCMNEEVSSPFYGRSRSGCLSFSNVQSAWDIKKPHLSPVGKLWAGMTSNSGSSEKRASSIPDLPSISEENENTDEVADTFQGGNGSEMTTSSVKREPLADITKSLQPPPSAYEAENLDDRHSLASVNTKFSFTGTSERAKHGNQNSNKRRYARTAKENQSMSLEINGVKRANQSVRNRFSKPKLSGKTSLRKGGPSMSERDSQPNNIVSNITSFIPLVKQKQAAEVITGKRDIKVKALEAAEAAKRLAEKKENERKMKKEALKLEQARIEEQNSRQLELEKEKKEEERKRKAADMAAKKRQREEDEKRERERKRKRIEEARRQQLENRTKLRAEKEQKEIKCKAAELKEKSGKDENMGKAKEGSNLQKEPEIESANARVSTIDARKSGVIPEACEPLGDHCEISQEVSYLCKATESDKLTSNISQEQSYEISPYKSSDDEDDEDEDDNTDMSNTKFVPSWASKKNVALILSSQQGIDPESIFYPESFCDIAEVVLLAGKLYNKRCHR